MRLLAHFLYILKISVSRFYSVKRHFHKKEHLAEKMLTTLWISVFIHTI